jgi:two-component system sensor histidine kinase GlrK
MATGYRPVLRQEPLSTTRDWHETPPTPLHSTPDPDRLLPRGPAADRCPGHQSQRALFQSVLVTQGSQVLAEAITAMERNARQYQVLGDKVLFEVYQENHERFADTVRTLETLELADNQRKLLDALFITEQEVQVTLGIYPHDAPETVAALQQFATLAELAQQVIADNRDLINQGMEQIQADSQRVQRNLVVQAIALIPAALLLAAVFAVLITRPINQLDRAIRLLGDEKLNKPLAITGPRDLEQLGERLNWLRGRLLELEQEKTRFLQHISHELKTPLTAIRESAELMGEQVVGDLNAQQREIIGILRDNSLQLQKLIEDLLNFSILRARASQLSLQRVAMKTIIEQVLEDHKVTLFSRKLDLRASLQPVSLEGDAEKLRTLVDNLLSNAIKYSPDGGPLWILLSRRGANAIIEVADSGPGIPAGERERVFEAFFQGAPATGGRVRGTGLGLSIAREYAQAHGGDISVVNSSKVGARLQVVLPLTQDS